MAPDNGGSQPKKILILAGAGASKHAGYPCGPELSRLIWDALPEDSRRRIPCALSADFELLYDVLERSGDRSGMKAHRNALFDALRPDREVEGTQPVWPQLVDPLFEAGRVVWVFTPNYDSLLTCVSDIEGGPSCEVGPWPEGSPGPGEAGFDVAWKLIDPASTARRAGGWLAPLAGKVGVVYLHGCVLWAGPKARPDGLVDVLFQSGPDGLPHPTIPPPGREALLWPRRGKVPIEPPFLQAYQALARASRCADVVLVIGCKLQDPALWASLLLTASNRCDPPPVALVDMPSEPGKEHEHPYEKLPDVLKKKCQPFYEGFNADTAAKLVKWIDDGCPPPPSEEVQ